MIKKLAIVFSVFVSIFAGFFVANSAFAYQITVQTQGDTIIEPQNGQVKTKTSPIVVQTDCRQGYTLQIQGPTDTNLYLAGDAANNEVDKFIRPVNTASSLSSQLNTYGYNLISNQTNQIFTPLTSTAVTLKDLAQTANPSADIDDTTNIYWGVNAGLTLTAGTYQMPNNGAATYIITTSPLCINYTVNFDKNSATATGTMDPQPISVNIPTKLEPNQFTNNSAFLGWNTKPDGTGDSYTNEEEVLDLALAEQSITLYAQWDTCLFDSVCYQGNGADAGLSMADQTTDATATTTTLWAPNFKRAGYGFVSWNTKPDGTGIDYGPNQTIDQALTKDGLRLYAKWLQSDGTPLQNWGGCASLSIGDSVALTDTRDNDTYTVTKLADDNCWMTENLRLGGSSSIALTTGNTDTSTNFSLNASTSTDWNSELSSNNTDRILLNADNTINSASEMTSPDNNVYAYGNYYNWYTATAKTGDYNMNSVTTSSICPKGWSLPTGDNANPKSFAYLNIKLGGTDGPAVDNPTLSNRYRSYPNNFVYSGYYDSSNTIELRGTRSSITSASPWSGSDTEILYLWLDDTNVSPAIRSSLVSTYGHKYEGYAVRCITTNTQVASYTVKFDANGGTGNMSPKNIVLNQPTALPSNAFTAPESWQTFNGWTTNPDGTGDFYTNAEVLNTPIANSGEVITLYALWGCPPNKICYRDNGANSSTKMSQQSASANTKTDLWANNFQYSGYGFAGWSPDKDAGAKLADPANALTSPVVYGPNETIVTPSDLAQKGLTLYAVWIKSAGDIQAWRGCDSLNFGQLTALTDTRDNQTYAVSKLADGTCWTLENLRLDSTATITAENTDNPVAGFTLPASSAPSTWCQTDNKNCVDQTTLYSINTVNPVPNMNNKNNNAYSYGNYYNYASATAGHGRYGENLTINQPGSVCPAGWHLPTARTPGLHNDHPGSYTYLNQQLGGGVSSENNEVLSNAWRSYPNNLIYSGEVTNGNLSQLGDAAYYWSSTPSISVAGGTSSSDYTFATIANIVASNFRVAPGMLSTKRYYGTTLRCVVRDAYTVKFDANGGSGDMPDQTIYTDVATKLSANTFTNSPKSFVGWNTKPDGTGDSYTNEQEVTDLVGKDETITLYAQWGVTLEAAYAEAGMTKHNGYYKMQDMSSAICDAATIIGEGSRMTAIDTRDNKTYIITKLADGRCWMVQNLALGGSSPITLTPQDSNVITDFILEPSTSGSFGSSNVTNASTVNLNRMHDNGNDWIDSNNKSQSSGTPPSPTQYVGNNYNWYTATAGTGTYEMNTDGANATSSVCPKGWRLPTATAGDGEFRQLYLAYGNLADFISAFSAIYSGMWNSDTLAPGNRGLVGSWWSSTAKDSADVWHAWIESNGFTPRMYHRKRAGYSVRCIAQESTPLGQISTMQEMTPGICAATPVGTEAVLKDTRDGKTYSVAKLEDGNCWMTEDLDHDIDATKTYTPADTDISSNWTPDVSTINIQGLNVGENVSGWVGAFGDNGLASADPGEVYWDGSTNRHSRIGNYYNWTAALAVNDSGAYSNGTETDPSQNPQTSICPKGWRLPIIANENTGHVDEFKELNRLYNNGLNSTDSGLIASPLYFTRGGVVDQSSELQSVGDAGSYWSSTAGGPMYVFNTAYYFNHNAGYNDSYSSNIAFGYNIRCVARQSYTVSFNANSGSGNMADQIIARGISAKLKANEFSAPSGFVFDGWNTEANGSGTSYANEATVTNLADSGGTITLYAQWKDTRTGFDRIMTMQDMTSAICAEAAVGDTKRLRDTRDDKYYNVRKMEDNKCWMVQNLALTSPNGYTLTPADSDVSSEFVIEPGVINSTGETWRDEYEDKKHIFDAGNTWIEPTSAGSNANVKTTGTPPNEGQYIGAYYSYYTATAGTGPRSLESGDAPSSICPKGWKLPTSGTTTSDWAGLTGALVGITSNTSSASAQSFALQNAPAYLGMFGLFDAGSMGVLNQGSETYYMSSSASGMDSFYALRLGPKRIDPGNMAGVKRSGNVVRCVAR